jgi:hypothetical protein
VIVMFRAAATYGPCFPDRLYIVPLSSGSP